MVSETLKNNKICIATAFRESIAEGLSPAKLRGDLLAGVTVGVISIPLAMALAIACGVPPQYGLYTSIVSGALVAIFGGSRVNISGPTAAFVVILLPITKEHGLGGLLVATILAGVILVIMGIARMGQLVQFIPYPVTVGFTAGIAVVIAALQLKDFLGVKITDSGNHFHEVIFSVWDALPTAHGADIFIGALTLVTLLVWKRLRTKIPEHLVALLVGTTVASIFHYLYPAFEVETVGSRFQYEINGIQGFGIPSTLPTFFLPWQLPDETGNPIGISFELIRSLLGPAFAIAMLGAIESLLCAVVADGLTGSKHNPDSELIGQGIGNIVGPFFGAMTATAALARTATNVRAGGRTPVAAIVHSLVILFAVLVGAKYLSLLPMSSLAALLMVVAWNMSEAKHVLHITRVAPRRDVMVLLTCFLLTVVFDMVVAVAVGIVLAATLFIQRMSELTGVELLTQKEHAHANGIPSHISIYDINGPLFFGAAKRAISTLYRFNRSIEIFILDMSDVPMIDMTGLAAFQSLLQELERNKIFVIMCGMNKKVNKELTQAGIVTKDGVLSFSKNIEEAKELALAKERRQP